jgi:hypothetical protein
MPDLLDEYPEMCPGCGTLEKPLGDGPSSLMCIYQPAEHVVWCQACNMKYGSWLMNKYTDDGERYRWRPDCLVNIEAIRNGQQPKYVNETNPFNFGGPGGHP